MTTDELLETIYDQCQDGYAAEPDSRHQITSMANQIVATLYFVGISKTQRNELIRKLETFRQKQCTDDPETYQLDTWDDDEHDYMEGAVLRCLKRPPDSHRVIPTLILRVLRDIRHLKRLTAVELTICWRGPKKPELVDRTTTHMPFYRSDDPYGDEDPWRDESV